MTTETKYGICPHCYGRYRLKKDGTMGSHFEWKWASGRTHCTGIGLPPKPQP